MKLLKLAWIGAFVFAALVYPAAAIIGATAVEAYEIAGYDKDMAELRAATESLPPKTDPAFRKKVMQIYGVPTEQPIRFIFVPSEKFIRPPMAPELILLPVDRNQGEDPMQLQTIHFARPVATGGAAFVGLLLLGVWALLRRRKAHPAPSPQGGTS